MPAQQPPDPNEFPNKAKKQPGRPAHATIASELHVASSNDTLNRFLGYTRRSWMLNAPQVQPSPRPNKPKLQQAPPPARPQPVPRQHVLPSNAGSDIYKPQTAPRPSVLPSPAPSDEPSPAVSATHDSPNPAPVSLPQYQPMSHPAPRRADANQLRMPVTEARFVLGASPEVASDVAAAASIQTNGQTQDGAPARLSGDPVTGGGAVLSTPTGPSVLPAIRPRPTGQNTQGAQGGKIGRVHTPSSRDGQPGEGQVPDMRQQTALSPTDLPQSAVSYPSTLLPAAPAPSAQGHLPDSQPPAKRRRTEALPSQPLLPDVDLSNGVVRIHAYIVANGGLGAFTKDSEHPRFLLLQRACECGDVFFVALHQLCCTWTRNAAEVYAVLTLDHKEIDSGFYVVEQLLKQNMLMHPRHLDWLANFPAPLAQVLETLQNDKRNQKYADAIHQVASFLKRAAESYNSLMQASAGRKYPYLVDELVGQLDCRSSVLQHVLFTSSRRRLDVPDGPLGESLDALFFRDQQHHMDKSGNFVPMDPILDTGELEIRNAKLICLYKHAVAQASKTLDEQRRRSSQQARPSPSLQQSFTLASNAVPNDQTQQPSAQGGRESPASPAVTSFAPSPHMLTSHLEPNPPPVAQFSNPSPSHPLASFEPVPTLSQSARPNMGSQSNPGTPHQAGPPPGQPGQPSRQPSERPSGQQPQSLSSMANPNPRQQAAMQSWTSPGQLANEEVRGQPSPSQWLFQQQPQPGQPSSGLQSFQQEPQAPPQHHNQIFIQQQQAQQVQHAQQMLANMTNQQQHQNLLPFLPSLQQHQHQQQHQQQQHQHQHQQHQQHPYQQQQPQQMAAQYQSGSQTVNQLRQQLHERMLQQQQTARLQAQRQQQAQLATSHQMTALQNLLPASPATHPATRTGALSNQPQSSFPDPQAFFPNVIPTPGVSPVNLQFPSGSRAQHPLAQPNLASRGTAPESGPAVFGPSAAMRQANPQLQQQNAQAVSQMRLIPPLGHAIQLSDWPPDPYDRKAIMMSLHQADVRSPRRTVRHSAVGKLGDRFYQAVESFPVVPTLIAFVRRLLKYQFVVSETQFARISQTVPQAAGIPVMEHFNGSLRWRVRTCKIPPGKKQMAGPHEWVGMETSWPEHITISLNGRPIAVRRRQHNSRDQPSELTPFIRQGINELAIAVAEPKRKTPGQFAVAVEIVETRSHSSIIEHVWKNCVIQEDETLDRIKSRLSASRHDDDSVQIVAEDLSIDLADPFSRVMFKTPARGAHCTHMECFDLETWLETRPSKPVRCPHSSFIPCDCRDNPEPSVADKWKCPICDGDARPYALRIDGFLLGVRKRLEEEGKLKAKSILVARDGTWQPVVEDSDGDDTDEDDEGGVPRRTKKSASAGPPPATATAKKQPVEVIELLDD